MLIPIIAIGLIGWALAAIFAIVAWRNWQSAGEWRCRAEHFRRALRACDQQLQNCLDREPFEEFVGEYDPTMIDPTPRD